MSKIHNTTQDKILKLLISNKKTEFTIRSIAQRIKVDYKSVHIAVKRLIEGKSVNSRKAGQTILCSINPTGFNADMFRAEAIRKNELMASKDLYVMSNYFKDISEPFFILLLFGSYAAGKARKGSDIDLMIISDDEHIRKKAKEIVSKMPLKIHLLGFSSAELLSMIKTTEFNVGKEAMNSNIILFGIEDYYRLIQNA